MNNLNTTLQNSPIAEIIFHHENARLYNKLGDSSAVATAEMGKF